MIESDGIIEKALRSNRVIHDYVMAACHALLWVAALSFAAFFHLSPAFNHDQALLLSTLVAYGAYLSESILATVKTAAAAPPEPIYVRKMSLWKWILLNILVNTVLSLLYLRDPSMLYLIPIILTAGWQKYMDGRIPSNLLKMKNKK